MVRAPRFILPLHGGPDEVGPARVRMRSSDTPISFAPALSAVAWLTPATDEPGTLTVLPVPNAGRPHPLPLGGRIVPGEWP